VESTFLVATAISIDGKLDVAYNRFRLSGYQRHNLQRRGRHQAASGVSSPINSSLFYPPREESNALLRALAPRDTLRSSKNLSSGPREKSIGSLHSWQKQRRDERETIYPSVAKAKHRTVLSKEKNK
jgi:hypothetical protein